MLLAPLGSPCLSFLQWSILFPPLPHSLFFWSSLKVALSKPAPPKTMRLLITSWKTVSVEKPLLYKCGLTSRGLGSLRGFLRALDGAMTLLGLRILTSE